MDGASHGGEFEKKPLTKGVTMLKVVKSVGAVLSVIAGGVWCALDPKGYALSHYTKKELEEMGLDFDYH
jgi:hypothetical protein